MPNRTAHRFRAGLPLAISAAMLLIGSAGAVVPPARSSFLYGDVDGNGAVTIQDAVLALQGEVGLVAPSLRADVEPVNADGSRGDGVAKLGDVLGILRMAVGLDPQQVAHLTLTAGPEAIEVPSPTIAPNPDFDLRMTAADPDPAAVRLEYIDGMQFDFLVMQGDHEVWRWSRHREFPQMATSMTISPTQPGNFTATWNRTDDAGNPVPAGQYQVRGELPSANGGTLSTELAPLDVGGAGGGGLTVTLTTANTTYRYGQPVTMTLTETNTGTSDVKVYIGCITYYDFWVTVRGAEIWRQSRRFPLTCLAIGMLTLHPGESRKLSAVWNGQWTETPPPSPTAIVPPQPGPGVYEVHGKVSEPGPLDVEPAPVTITLTDAAPTDYFPLAVGSTWSYTHRQFGSQNGTGVTQKIPGTVDKGGATYFVFDQYVDRTNPAFREAADGSVFEATDAGDTTRYELAAAEGQQWKYDAGMGRAWTATMVSRNARLDTPYGTYTHLLEIAFLTGVDTSETDYLAPGIGLVAVDNRVNVALIPTLRLTDYTPGQTMGGGPVAFPLDVGDRWTYVNADPRLAAPTQPIVAQTIRGQDTDLASGKTYSIFDLYNGDAKVELREDAASVVWQRAPGGETERYELGAPVGATWAYAPDPNGARWNAHMTSRDAKLGTPYGDLTGLLEITFMGIDTGWTEYVDPGVGLVGSDRYFAPQGVFPYLRLKSFEKTAVGSGIEGVAMIGPTTPVCRQDVPCQKPYPGAIITVQAPGSATEIARAVTDDQGMFRIPLPPGQYHVVPLPAKEGILPRATPQDVTVPAEGFVEVTAEYDSGIR